MRKWLLASVLFVLLSLVVAATPVKEPAIPGDESALGAQALTQCGRSVIAVVFYDQNKDGDQDASVLWAVDMDSNEMFPFMVLYFEKGKQGAVKVIVKMNDRAWQEMAVSEIQAKYPNLCDLPILSPRA